MIRPLVKQTLRRAVDRLAMPYVEQIVNRVQQPPDLLRRERVPRTFVELALTLHEARTLALADMPKGAKTLLSAGASGSWYFDWIADNYGYVERHIGVELYSPRPDDLPPNVEWLQADIAATGGIEQLSSDSVDLVYSGQNVEHLWPDQVVAFLLESHRVLVDNGWLVVDSPNRDLTAAYGWSMTEHTLEMTPLEACHLLNLAGFDVATIKGLWLGRDGGQLLPLDPAQDEGGAASVLRRMVLAVTRPEDSFIWWAEARKTRPPDADAVGAFIRQLFEDHWPERVNRLLPAAGTEEIVASDGRRAVRRSRGKPGNVVEGPAMALPAGTFTFRCTTSWQGDVGPGAPIGSFSIMSGDQELATHEILANEDRRCLQLEATVTLPATRFGMGIRIHSNGLVDLTVDRQLVVEPPPWRPSQMLSCDPH